MGDDLLRLISRDKSPFWYLEWYDATLGRMCKRSTGTGDRAEAEQVRVRALLDVGSASATGSPEAPPVATTTMTVTAKLEYYYEDHAKTLAKTEQAKIAIHHLQRHFGELPVVDPTLLAQTGNLQARYEIKLGPNQDRRIAPPRSAGSFPCCGRQSIWRRRRSAVSWPRIYDLPAVEPRDRWFTKDEVAKLLAATALRHVWLYIHLALVTAARPEAIFDLTWQQVDFASGVIRLNPEGRAQNEKRRPKARIPDSLLATLHEAKTEARSAHVIEFAGAKIDTIKTAFRETAKRAGFVAGDVVPYTLRHTAATWMAQRGVPLLEIADYVGHADTRMVERHYIHHHPDYQTKAREAMAADMAELGGFTPVSPHSAKPAAAGAG